MNDKPSNEAGDRQAAGAMACRARRLGASNLVECQAAASSCYWRVCCGENRLCRHASNQMIAMGVLPAAWLPDVVGTP